MKPASSSPIDGWTQSAKELWRDGAAIVSEWHKDGEDICLTFARDAQTEDAGYIMTREQAMIVIYALSKALTDQMYEPPIEDEL